MKRAAQLLSMLALVAVLVVATLFFTDYLSLAATQRALLAATLGWFLATPFWMGRAAGK